MKRFSNPAQLIRHTAENTDRDEESLWEEYKAKTEQDD